MNTQDKENFSWDKIWWWFTTCKWELWKKMPYKLDKFSDLSLDKIQQFYWDKIEAILLDIDDCVAPAYWEILEENIQKVKEILDSGIKIGVLSNGININQRCKPLTDLWVQICDWKASKPSIQAYIDACNQLWVQPQNTLMIWDDISKDGGALQSDINGGMIIWWYIPVKSIWNKYSNIPWIWKRINYFFKKVSRDIANYRNWL